MAFITHTASQHIQSHMLDPIFLTTLIERYQKMAHLCCILIKLSETRGTEKLSSQGNDVCFEEVFLILKRLSCGIPLSDAVTQVNLFHVIKKITKSYHNFFLENGVNLVILSPENKLAPYIDPLVFQVFFCVLIELIKERVSPGGTIIIEPITCQITNQCVVRILDNGLDVSDSLIGLRSHQKKRYGALPSREYLRKFADTLGWSIYFGNSEPNWNHVEITLA
ncbi:MAG: hypothetical protein C0514_08170 [Candidatus Puniceispirillum sp.]|nr:hypothetical protein [Candidatus Puniceispirillum sp.]